MSIRQETFKEKMAEAKMLLGSPMKVEAFNAIWDRFKDSFTTSDFSQAMDIVIESGEKLIYPVILRALRTCKNRRMEAELRTSREKEAKEARLSEGDVGMAEVKTIIADMQKRIGFDNGKFLGLPIIKNNTVLIRKDGTREKCYMDPNQPGFDDACMVVYVQDGEARIRQVYIDPLKVKIIRKTDRKEG